MSESDRERTSIGAANYKMRRANNDDDDSDKYAFECVVCERKKSFDADDEGERNEAREEFMEHAREDHDGFVRYELVEV